MRLRIAVLALLAIACAQASRAWADDASIAVEVKAAMFALNNAFQAQDIASIESMVTPDHLGVSSYYGRPLNTADEIATIAEFKADYFDFTDPVVTVLGPDAAQITYENSFKGTFEGRELPKRVFVSSIWLRQNGKWLQQFYQDTPINAE